MATSTREKLIEITCDLLELQGYHATGLSQIINESGAPKGSLYYHFPGGKEALAVEALQVVGAAVLQRIREQLAQNDDANLAIRQFITQIAYQVEQSGYRAGGPITTIAMETAATHERLRLFCAGIYGDWQTAFTERLLAAGWDETRAKPLATLIIASIEGGVILCRSQRSPQPLLEVAEGIYRLLQTGS